MSIDFEPVAIGRRPRRFDPLLVGVVVVAVALGAAVIKPWDLGDDAGPSAPPAVAAVPSAESSLLPAATATPRPSRPPPAEPPTWADFDRVVVPQDAWGVQTIVRRQTPPWSLDRPTYLADWSPTVIGPGGSETARVEPPNGPIVVLGLTMPRDANPEAIRIWREHLSGELEWMDAVRVDDQTPGNRWFLLRPGTDELPYMDWRAGHYWIEVLLDAGIRRIAVDVPDRSGDVPAPDAWTIDQEAIVPASMSDPPVIFAGMFAYVDGRAVALPAAAHAPLEEEAAWRDVTTSGGAGIVASAFLPRASALGIMLPPGAVASVKELRRLSPATAFEAPPALPGNSDRRGHSPFIVFEAPDGGVWAPGIYAITVDWTYNGSAHTDTWHVELRPGRQ